MKLTTTAALFADMIRATGSAASPLGAKYPHLAVIRIDTDADGVTFTATDSYRAHIVRDTFTDGGAVLGEIGAASFTAADMIAAGKAAAKHRKTGARVTVESYADGGGAVTIHNADGGILAAFTVGASVDTDYPDLSPILANTDNGEPSDGGAFDGSFMSDAFTAAAVIGAGSAVRVPVIRSGKAAKITAARYGLSPTFTGLVMPQRV